VARGGVALRAPIPRVKLPAVPLIQLRRGRAEHERPPEALFCSKPFRWLDVSNYPTRASAFLCCPAWLPSVVGNLQDQSLAEVWNGEAAREVRRSILDGSFRYCTKLCPWLQTTSGPVQRVDSVTDPELRAILDQRSDVVPAGPLVVNAAFDRSCNLACPSCRKERIVESEAKREILALQEKLTREALGGAKVLYITGSGDPFGSPYFFSWLRRMRAADMPELALIHLHTNAQLWTPGTWRRIDPGVRALVKSAEISIDAATEGTYAKNRVGGRWSRLLANLDFIAGLRAAGPLEYLKIHMVVQDNNYREMPAFVALGKRLGVDAVYFSRLGDWRTFSRDEYGRRTVHDPAHPRHADFLRVLFDESLRDPVVRLGNLTEFLRTEGAREPASQASPGAVGRLVESMI
jgi:hypothetical protein